LKKKASKVVRWKAIASSMKERPIFTRWTDEDKANLKLLLSDDVDIAILSSGVVSECNR
jgi:hypothetical protein